MLFFLVVLGVLGLLHAFLYFQLAGAWPDGGWFLGAFLTALLLTPFLLFYARYRGWAVLTRGLAGLAFSWLGVLFLADCVLAGFWILNFLIDAFGGVPLSASMTVVAGGVVTAVGIAYGVVEARRPGLKTVRLSREGLKGRGPTRIVQISDLHLGYVADRDRLADLVERIIGLNPDVIVSTGDLFDGDYGRMGPITEILGRMRAPLGKFAISGNHEVYEGLDGGLELTRQAGFRILRGEAVSVSPGLSIVGVDDVEALSARDAAEQERTALAAARADSVVVLLKHRPTICASSLGRFDLQLSGHTHGGQIFPFNLLTRLAYRRRPGLQWLGQDSWLYLSRGTGTWGPQFRIFAPPEITLIELSAPE